MLARRLGIKDVLVDDVCGPPGILVVRLAEADLANGSILTEDIVHFITRYLVRQAPETQIQKDAGRKRNGEHAGGNKSETVSQGNVRLDDHTLAKYRGLSVAGLPYEEDAIHFRRQSTAASPRAGAHLNWFSTASFMGFKEMCPCGRGKSALRPEMTTSLRDARDSK